MGSDRAMSAGIYTTPAGRDYFYDCEAGIHVWRDRKLFRFRILECIKCGELNDCGLGRKLLDDLLMLEAKKNSK